MEERFICLITCFLIPIQHCNYIYPLFVKFPVYLCTRYILVCNKHNTNIGLLISMYIDDTLYYFARNKPLVASRIPAFSFETILLQEIHTRKTNRDSKYVFG